MRLKTIIKNDVEIKDLKEKDFLYLELIQLEDTKKGGKRYGVRDWYNMELSDLGGRNEIFNRLWRDFDVVDSYKGKLELTRDTKLSNNIKQGLNYIRLEKRGKILDCIILCKIRKWND